MANKKQAAVDKGVSLTVAQIDHASKAYKDAVSTAARVGESVVQTLCNVWHKTLPAGTLSAASMTQLLDTVSDAMGWKGKTRPVQQSCVRAMVNARATLPEACELLRTSTNTCSWVQATNLARKIAAGATPEKAAKEVAKKGKPNTRKIASKADAVKYAMTAIAAMADRFAETPHMPKHIITELRAIKG